MCFRIVSFWAWVQSVAIKNVLCRRMQLVSASLPQPCAGKWSGETSLSLSFSNNILKWNRSPFSKLVWLWLIIFCHSFSVCVLRIRSNEWITMLVICEVCYQMWLACSYEIKSPVSLKQTTEKQTPPYSLDFNCIMVPELQDYCLWNIIRICFMCVIVPADDLWSF